MRNDISTAENVRAGKNIFSGPLEVPNLSTYCEGAILGTELIQLESGTLGGAYCYGAEYYHAVNLASTGGDTLPAGFVTETANQNTYHAVDDNLGVFGSYAYSGQNEEATLVGGMVLQASEPHGARGREKHLGTRLLLVYTPNGSVIPEAGAMIDGDGTFAVGSHFRHFNGNVGFFGVNAVPQQPVPQNATVADLVAVLVKFGLMG